MGIRDRSVSLLTEDRRATGIMGVLSVADNISIASLDALRKGPIMLDDKKILDLVATNKEKMAIKVPSPKTCLLYTSWLSTWRKPWCCA